MGSGVQRLSGPLVILQGPALLHARHLLALGVQVLRQRDGITPPAAIVDLVRAVTDAAEQYRTSPPGHGDVPAADGAAGSETAQTGRLICTTEEAAMILKLSTRQVRRLDLARVSKPGAPILFDRGDVEAYAAGRVTS